ncbi:MAG: MBOAT family O-acyltransferase [Candidatus Competibacter sp.]
MYFDSTTYFIFLFFVTGIYWCLSLKWQNRFLLIASYFFYGWWDWRFLFLIGASTVLNFILAKKIYISKNKLYQKRIFVSLIVINLTFLGFFKYFNFFVDSFTDVLLILGLDYLPKSFWQIALPPAISFYTFQEIAYIVDIYNRRLKPADSLIDYALFVSLFPHLIAGPIQQPLHLLPQVQFRRKWDSQKFFDGLMLLLEGLFRKVVIADNCGLIADAAFNGGFGEPSIMVILLGTYAFAWQIYGDFSGYSNMARGSALLIGFHFMVNFRQPYLSKSLRDFWRRWHISLSFWLRDYLYKPLGGNHFGELLTYRNLIFTMLLGGLWHGANWTFIVWGGIHGIGLAIERFLNSTMAFFSEENKFFAIWIRRFIVFHFICFSWLFFRTYSLDEALHVISGLFTWIWLPVHGVALIYLVLHVFPLLLIDIHLETSKGEYIFEYKPLIFRIGIGIAFVVFITLLGGNQSNAFIYFQF